MNIAQDGHLTLHLYDLREASETRVKKVPEGKDPTKISSFSIDAQITAAYAWLAGHKVTFSAPGIQIDVNGPCRYFSKHKQS